MVLLCGAVLSPPPWCCSLPLPRGWCCNLFLGVGVTSARSVGVVYVVSPPLTLGVVAFSPLPFVGGVVPFLVWWFSSSVVLLS